MHKISSRLRNFVTFLTLIGGVLLFWPPLYAESYNEAYQLYIKSDFKGAIVSLGKVLKTSFDKEEIARAAKLLGICHYMNGDQKAATKAFRAAIKADPTITISKSEVLDESIADFFQDQKTIYEDDLMVKKMEEDAKKAAIARKNPPKTAPTEEGAAAVVGLDDDPSSAAGKGRKKKGAKPEDDMGLAPEIKSEPSAKERAASKKAQKGSFSFFHLLPLGVGQFYNGSYLLGTFFAAAQIAPVVYWSQLDASINKVIASSDAIQDDSRYTQLEKDKYFTESDTYTKKNRKTQMYALIAAGSFWGISILHAVLTVPDFTPVPAKKPKKKFAANDLFFDPSYPRLTAAFVPQKTQHGLVLAPMIGLKMSLDP